MVELTRLFREHPNAFSMTPTSHSIHLRCHQSIQTHKAPKKKNGCASLFEMSAQDCTANQNWGKTFELQSTTVMSALLDCQIMNIYCIMKMWWHLEQSHLTLSSCASVSPLSANAFCSKECILKDSGRNVSQSRHCSRAGVISNCFLNSREQAHTHTCKGALSFTIPPSRTHPPALFFPIPFRLCPLLR